MGHFDVSIVLHHFLVSNNCDDHEIALELIIGMYLNPNSAWVCFKFALSGYFHHDFGIFIVQLIDAVVAILRGTMLLEGI